MSTTRGASKLIRKARLEDLGHLAANIRPEDAAEIKAHIGMGVPAALSMCWSYGDPFVGVSPRTGNPVAIFGVVPSEELPGAGICWMVGTTELPSVAVSFIKATRHILPVLHKDYDLIYNYLDARNTLHLQWVKRMGFKVLRLVPEFGVERRPFYEIARIQSCASSQRVPV